MKAFKGKLYIFIGEPGSGKSTQAHLIREKLGAAYLNMGEALRLLSGKKTPLGRRVASYINKGKLAPLKISKEVVRNFLRAHIQKKVLVFDGYPRSMGQVRNLHSLLKDFSFTLQVIFIKIGKREALRRLKHRLFLEKRRDDADRRALETRFRIFKKKTQPVVAFYRRRGLLRLIDGRGSISQVFRRIAKVLE